MPRDDEERPRKRGRKIRSEPTNIVNYVVLEAANIQALRVEVLRHVDDGWEPIGGVCVVPPTAGGGLFDHSHRWWYHQAMILREKRLPNTASSN